LTCRARVTCLPHHRSVRPLLKPGDQRSIGQPKNALRVAEDRAPQPRFRMDFENRAVSLDTAGDLPDHTLPSHPGFLTPSPDGLCKAFWLAMEELERTRGRRLSRAGYVAGCHSAVFWAGWRALADSACDIVRKQNPDTPWARSNPAPAVAQLHVVASGPGSGKTTAAKAFMVALTRAMDQAPFPIGCALLVHHIETAHRAFDELSALLPGKVAIWTSEHDADRPYAVRQPRFAANELEEYAVIVVTQEFFKGIRGDRARYFNRNGIKFPRVVTFIDEKVSEIELHDLLLSQVVKVVEHVQDDDHAPTELRDGLSVLQVFVQSKQLGDRNLETPAHDGEAWKAADQLRWFTMEEAGQYARTHSAALRNTRRARATPKDMEAVFGFARCMAEGRAFISRRNHGKQGSTFVAYERILPQYTGMVLLDATADIDGVTKLCRWRKHVKVPQERYDRLEIVHVPSIATETLAKWLRHHQNRLAYVQHIQRTVLEHVGPEQKALIVCKLDVVLAHPPIENWSEHVAQFTNRKPSDDDRPNRFPWDFEGRKLGLTWWGGYGVGANDWHEADVVLLFDDFHLPRHTVIALTQGLKGAKATQAPLADMADTSSKVEEVENIRVGHLLRWLKQLALRGKARQFDETGQCAAQKLVLTGDRLLLVEHRQRLFPGASISYKKSEAATHLEALIDVLVSEGLGDTVKAVDVASRMGVEWRKVTKGLTRHPRFQSLVTAAGWQYVPNQGRRGSMFVRPGRAPVGLEALNTSHSSADE
jgi:hypothetical protein